MLGRGHFLYHYQTTFDPQLDIPVLIDGHIDSYLDWLNIARQTLDLLRPALLIPQHPFPTLAKQTAATHMSDSHLWLPLSLKHFSLAPVSINNIAATTPRPSPTRPRSSCWMTRMRNLLACWPGYEQISQSMAGAVIDGREGAGNSGHEM